MTQIYLDHASSTPVEPEILKLMNTYHSKWYANPSSLHQFGETARLAVEEARFSVAQILGSHPDEIIFTSGGTESVNLALQGIAFARGKGHIITSTIEHPAVLGTCRFLETMGFQVTYVKVNKQGLVSPSSIRKAICRDTILISIMYANNEIGTIQQIKEIGKIAKKQNILFHTDSCQAGLLNLNVQDLHVDLMTLNGSKIYGPKGIGILFKRLDLHLQPTVHGGGQEFGVRSGTENVPGIVGFSKALQLVQKNRIKKKERLSSLRDYFIKMAQKNVKQTYLNGHPTKRLSNNINISFAGVDSDTLVQHLSQEGIYCSSGSACTANKIEASHVLQSIGAKHATSSVRFSLGKTTRKADLNYVIKKLAEIVLVLRKV